MVTGMKLVNETWCGPTEESNRMAVEGDKQSVSNTVNVMASLTTD
jgi:hypothetical protein